ncbi:hypothetical protein PRZ48_001545 [Zasmidium cellare]|uniref:EKC/KEOPS complex subunit BUD32 n=1 Tax=Zasmidium cellare TaxID=395010 RepID=A0ABR0F3E9_ZASCE|nr:hypothetical protein PRZ48_001545 [Zasmidium cellare]
MTAVNGSHYPRLPLDKKIEEETLPDYKAERYYPVHIGDIFNARYKVVAKLGFGTASTVWLCRDLETNQYQTLKVGIAQKDSSEANNEVLVSRHISTVEGPHPGRQWVRPCLDDFVMESTQGEHQCLVFRPMGMTLTEFRNMTPAKAFDKELLQQTLQMVAVALDFLHQAEVVHTDLSPNNILLGIDGNVEPSFLSDIEKAEIEFPSPRKEFPDRSIYVSQGVSISHGGPAITDFGAARIGATHRGDVMPAVYRAPEVIFNMQWDFKIDTWAFGCMIFDLFEGGRLFRAVKDNVINDELHVAEMVSLMGPPPKEFLKRSPDCNRYWDSEGELKHNISRDVWTNAGKGNWIAETPIPQQSLESRERRLEGTDKELLLDLLRKILCWLPEERASAYDIFEHGFILQYLKQDDQTGEVAGNGNGSSGSQAMSDTKTFPHS